MNNTELARSFFTLVEEKNWEKLSEITHEDFIFWGPMSKSLSKEKYFAMQEAIQKAFPDWSYNVSNITEEESCLVIAVHITATHTEELSLPIRGSISIPATHIKIELPVEKAVMTFKDGKIFEINVEETSYTGFSHLFRLLGIK